MIRRWEGIPLYLVAGMVDDQKRHDAGAYNARLAKQGYDIQIETTAGEVVTIDSRDIAGKDSIVLLGMGTDGHTASLFPGTGALEETDRWFIDNEVPQLDTWRLTASIPLIQRARTVMVFTAGESKASVLSEVLEGPDGVYPIQLLRHAAGEVVWLIDEAAASQLTETPLERPAAT